jgi:hypothetical protein
MDKEQIIKELKTKTQKLRNLHSIENLEDIMGFGIGDTTLEILDLIELL